MKDQLTALFQTRPEHPLFYVESGSRLWGIASPDSDYDVRGFHLPAKEQYFDFKKQRDLIEVMDGDFDFVSYDIDKMFGLLAKSNPTVLEWIRAHIVYWNVLPHWAETQAAIIEHIDFKALYHHYLSLAGGSIQRMEKDRNFTYKTVFYGIRGLLSAELAGRGLIPELGIDRLFAQFEVENEVLKIAKDSLDKKRLNQEKQAVAAGEKPVLLAKIKAYAQQLAGQAPPPADHRKKLRDILRAYSFELKATYYK
jgi:predicted nucleotidyltransferase